MCTDLWTWHGQASLSTQPNPQAWDSIRFSFSWQSAHVSSAFTLFSVVFFFFLSFSGSLFSNFPPPYNSGSPRAVSAHRPAGRLIIRAAMWRALIWGTLRCRRTEIREPCETRGNVGWWFEAAGKIPRLSRGHDMSRRRPGSRAVSCLPARAIIWCNGPSSCVINSENNTDTVSERTANSLSDLEDNYSRSAADRP